MSVHKAGWKVRLMSGTYILQATRDKFHQHEVDPSCLLCRKEPENTEHFLMRCEALSGIRQPFLGKIIQTLQDYMDVGQLNRSKADDREFATLILDCTGLINEFKEPVLGTFLHELESTFRGFCFALHLKRTTLLSQSY